MAVDERTAAVQIWSRQEAAAVARQVAAAQAVTFPWWQAFEGWYTAAQVQELAQRTLEVLTPARVTTGNIAAAYIREVASSTGFGTKAVRGVQLSPPRLGADMRKVYSRPASAYRLTFALTADLNAAQRVANDRLAGLIATDIAMARRDGEHQAMERAGATGYRRVIHPELSESGTCGMCIAAAHRKYKIGTLQPMHFPTCRCTVAMITDAFDPISVTKADLAAAYATGGSTSAEDLKRTRFQVNQHGELGPVIGIAGQHFQGPGDPDKADPVTRARRRLHAAEDALGRLEGMERTPLRDQQLKFQHAFMDHLRDVAQAA